MLAFNLDNVKTDKFGMDNPTYETLIKAYIDAAAKLSTYVGNQILKLAPWSCPITTFLVRFFELKYNSPQYDDQEAACVAYFGMIAQQPTPTDQVLNYAVNWREVDNLNYGEFLNKGISPNYANVLFEHLLAYGMSIKDDETEEVTFGWSGGTLWYGGKDVLLKNVAPQDSYIESVYHLNKYLYWNGLYDGVQKALSEESRKLQGLRAQALASQAAAAKALALSRSSEDVSEEAIIKYENKLKESEAKEQELIDYINKLNNTPQGTGGGVGGGSGLAALAVAALSFFAFKG